MKRQPLVGVMILCLVALATAAEPAEYVPLSTLTTRIQKTSTASEAIAAYADGVARAGADFSIRRAFISKVIELKQPELAVEQARELTQITREGLPWAVLAYSDARQNKMATAFSEMQTAAQLSPTDDFVIQTAGELVAWYDTVMDPGTTPAEISDAVKSIRDRIGSRSRFTDAYEQANKEMQWLSRHPEAAPADNEAWEKAFAVWRDSVKFASADTSSPPMSIFYAAPYAMFPGYASWYQPYGANVYYYYNLLHRGIGQQLPFPFPAVGVETRYLKLNNGGGFALMGDGGTDVYQAVGGFGNPVGYNGFYGGYADPYYSYYGPPAAFIVSGGFVGGPRVVHHGGGLRGMNNGMSNPMGPQFVQPGGFGIGMAPFPISTPIQPPLTAAHNSYGQIGLSLTNCLFCRLSGRRYASKITVELRAARCYVYPRFRSVSQTCKLFQHRLNP